LPQVLAEAEQLTASGHQEIVLVGAHLGAYGKDFPPCRRTNLSDCVRQVLSLPGLGRVRLSSLEPMEVTREMVSSLAEEPKFCRHLHLPLQSGDDSVLQRMNREYRAADYAEIANWVAHSVPGMALGADVIVGFPAESERQFLNTCDLIESLPIAYLHVFSYSLRPATAAASLPNQIPEQDKKRRNRHLRAISERKQIAFRHQLLGSRQTALIVREGAGKTLDEGAEEPRRSLSSGLTDNYVRVQIPNAPEPGNLVEVEITEVNGAAVYGRALTA
jgi:threonylcarbamoyladenosine tRNA methylthiotransferase MtaB